MAKLVSKTYGEALFEVAMESGEDKAVQLQEEIKTLRTVLAENPEFDELMEHPGIPKQEKLQVLDQVFEGRIRSLSTRSTIRSWMLFLTISPTR